MSAIVSTNSIGTGIRISMAPGDIVDVIAGATVASTDNSIAISSTTGGSSMTLRVAGQVYGYDGAFFSSGSALANVTVLAGGSLTGNGGDGYACLGTDYVVNYGLIGGDTTGAEEYVSRFFNYGSVSGGSAGDGILVDNSAGIFNSGSISSVGLYGIYVQGTNGEAAIVNTGTLTGAVGGIATNASATFLSVVNSGTISGVVFGVGISAGASAVAAITNSVGGAINGEVSLANLQSTVENSGTINGSVLSAAVQNYGTIKGQVVGNSWLTNSGIVTDSVEVSSGVSANAGRILGSVFLSGTSPVVFDSTFGTVGGAISIGDGGGTVVGGQSGGLVTGGSGNDILYANPTQAASDNADHTTLGAGQGINALYGDGAYTTFIAGDPNGGYNQIWGGASQMTGVTGYTNNALSFATAAAGVYVDLLNGHDAYVGTGSSWTGSGAYEDSIVNVPNVIGSALGDLIQADNGIDRITGGGGADQLYAGSGGSSQDTFVYTAYGDSNVVSGYDTIVGFKIGADKIDLSALHTDGSHLAISTAGTSNTLYVEQTPGTFYAATDLALIVNTTTTGGLHASDFVF